MGGIQLLRAARSELFASELDLINDFVESNAGAVI
jgi:hypothetical protein